MIPDKEMTEKELDRILFSASKGLAIQTGWTFNYHVLRSKGSQSGFPDRVLIRDRAIYIELKSQTNKPSEEQQRWLTALARAGCETYLVRPADVDEMSRILARRWQWKPWALHYNHRDSNDESWQPNCLWLPAGYRKDNEREEQHGTDTSYAG